MRFKVRCGQLPERVVELDAPAVPTDGEIGRLCVQAAIQAFRARAFAGPIPDRVLGTFTSIRPGKMATRWMDTEEILRQAGLILIKKTTEPPA
jgi:hypothetical protein